MAKSDELAAILTRVFASGGGEGWEGGRASSARIRQERRLLPNALLSPLLSYIRVVMLPRACMCVCSGSERESQRAAGRALHVPRGGSGSGCVYVVYSMAMRAAAAPNRGGTFLSLLLSVLRVLSLSLSPSVYVVLLPFLLLLHLRMLTSSPLRPCSSLSRMHAPPPPHDDLASSLYLSLSLSRAGETRDAHNARGDLTRRC